MQGSLYNHPRLVILLILLIVISGLNSFYTMPRLEDPHLESRIIQISTFYPGADAERVEAEVTEKLERKIREVAEVKEVRSTSRPNISFINVELEDRVKNARVITTRLRDKISEVTDLPDGAFAPDFSDTRMYAHSAIIALSWNSESPINYAILGRYGEELANRIRNLAGTDFVDILGVAKEEIRVTIDDVALAAHGLTASDVAARIRASDARGAAGIVEGDTNNMVVQVSGALDGLSRIRRIPLKFDEAGASLRVGDVARVERTFEDPPSRLALMGGQQGIIVAARMFEDSRIDEWSQDVGAILDSFAHDMPASLKLERIFDERDYADERLYNLLNNLAVGAMVVLAILLVTLGYRSSLVAASILPLTLLASLVVTHLIGLRIEQILVTGFIVALGIMVDNAIVITEEIQQLRLKGERRSVAVGRTVRKFWMPLAGSTITTIIAFMPLVLMNGNAGEFMIGVPVAVIGSLVTSYVIAFTIISAIAGRIVEGPDETQSSYKRVWWRDGIEGKLISGMFQKSLLWSVKRPLRSMILASFIPLLGFVSMGQLTEQFFPISDRNQFNIQVSLPGQASIFETKQAALDIHNHLSRQEGVVADYWFISTRPAKFFYAMFSSGDGVSSFAESVVLVEETADVARLVPRLQRELATLFPEATVLVKEFNTGPPIQAPLELRVLGPELGVLYDIGEQIRSVLVQVPNVTYTRSSITAGRPMINVKAREDDVSVTGLSLSDVERQLQALTNGIVATHLVEQTEQVPVRVISDRRERADIQSVADMNLIGVRRRREADRSFDDLPVSAFADVELISKVGTITRLDGVRMNNVQAFLEYGVLPEEAAADFRQRIADADIKIPAGYSLEFGGEGEKRDEAVAKLFGTAGMLIILMVLAIVLTFNSFRLAFITFGAAVQAAGLGILSLWFFGYPLSFVVIIGLMGLIGLAINAAIVILSELRGSRAARRGSLEAAVGAVMSTGRHIVSTTLTTVGGFMPLIIAGGDFWPPFAIAVAGGAFLSMIVSFYFAPAAFVFVTKYKEVSSPNELKRRVAEQTEVIRQDS